MKTQQELLRQVKAALHNIGGNIYHGMVDDVGYKDKSPDWQYIQNEVKQALSVIDELLRMAGEQPNGTWRAYIKDDNNKVISIGKFQSEIEAAKAYDEYAIKLRGEFAWLNFSETRGKP